jgi:hypothetical protein
MWPISLFFFFWFDLDLQILFDDLLFSFDRRPFQWDQWRWCHNESADGLCSGYHESWIKPCWIIHHPVFESIIILNELWRTYIPRLLAYIFHPNVRTAQVCFYHTYGTKESVEGVEIWNDLHAKGTNERSDKRTEPNNTKRWHIHVNEQWQTVRTKKTVRR